jgi:multisubunit Na+/H+ antiporter MnhB subunit
MRRSLLLDTTVRLVFDSVLVLSIYLLFAGHNQPGGGFVGGLVAAAAIALRFVAGGIDAVRATFRVRPWSVLGSGLGLATVTALMPLLVGDAPLDNAKVAWEVPILGTVKATSAVVFDAGVYLVVVGLVLMVFEALGDDPDEEASPRCP